MRQDFFTYSPQLKLVIGATINRGSAMSMKRSGVAFT
jgi:hypothetical protein